MPPPHRATYSAYTYTTTPRPTDPTQLFGFFLHTPNEILAFNIWSSRVDGAPFHENLVAGPNACAHHAGRSRQSLRSDANIPVDHGGQAWHPMGPTKASSHKLRTCTNIALTRIEENFRFVDRVATSCRLGNWHLVAFA